LSTRARWVVTARDGKRLADVLLRAGADADAVRDGRVFIGRRRARSADETVKPGDEVHLTAKAAATAPATLLADEDGLVAADKPADITTIPDHADASSSLLASVARALACPVEALHPTSRLDRGVSGVVIFARSEAAAERLRVAREHGTYARRYVAIASVAPAMDHGQWNVPIGRSASDPRHRAANGRDPAPALSRYTVVGRASAWALLALEPVTGRTHQLRVHASHGGAPLLGDRVYGGITRATLPSGRVLSFGRIALHAARVRVPRADGSLLDVRARVPAELREWWRAAGGDDAAWEVAVEG
jgi:23S rRNA pseudouridine1911/1915/1917 synthase